MSRKRRQERTTNAPVGEVMLRTTTEESRFYLTADLRAFDSVPTPKRAKKAGVSFTSELKRFPPVEEVVAALDRIASRAFVA